MLEMVVVKLKMVKGLGGEVGGVVQMGWSNWGETAGRGGSTVAARDDSGGPRW